MTNQDGNQLTNVHEALQEAATDVSKPKPMITGTFRIEQDSKALAEQICERHGTTLSAFLRKCCHGLVRDYQAPTQPAE